MGERSYMYLLHSEALIPLNPKPYMPQVQQMSVPASGARKVRQLGVIQPPLSALLPELCLFRVK